MPHIVWYRKENCVDFNEQNDRKQEKKWKEFLKQMPVTIRISMISVELVINS